MNRRGIVLVGMTWLVGTSMVVACGSPSAVVGQTPSERIDTSIPITTTLPVELTLDWPSPAATIPPGLIFRTDRLYTDYHLWVKQEPGNIVRLGVTHYGQVGLGRPDDLGMPKAGAIMEKGNSFDCFIVGDDCMIYDFAAPVSGTIVAVNERVEQDRTIINTSPYDDGWLVVVKIENPAELEDLLTYQEYYGVACPPCHCNH